MSYRMKRRSKLFRFTKYTFVFIALITAIVILYYVFVNQNNKISHNSKEEKRVENTSEPDISFKAYLPDLTGISLDHGPYYIQATEMQELAGSVVFVDPKVKLMLKHLDWLNVTAQRANLIKADQHLQLFDDIKANLNKIYYFKGNQAEIFAKESIIKSDHHVEIFTDEHNLKSQNGLVINYNDQTAFFLGKIDANLKRIQDKLVTNIKSDTLEVFWQKKIGDFLGHVILTRDGTIVEADKMTAIMDPITNQLEIIHAYGHVKIINKEQTAIGEYGKYIVATSILTLKDKVQLIKQGNVMTGELLYYNFNTQKANLVSTSEKSNQRVRAIILPKSLNE